MAKYRVTVLSNNRDKGAQALQVEVDHPDDAIAEPAIDSFGRRKSSLRFSRPASSASRGISFDHPLIVFGCAA
jgi:hypothetical protein